MIGLRNAIGRGGVDRLDQRWYPGVSKNWDDRMFRQYILARVTGRSRILDLGAGAGIVQEMNFRGIAEHVCGVDLDPRVLQNPFLDEAKIGSVEQIPYGDETFDLVFADNVLEHLENPDRVFSEVRRVLRPGGWFLAKTPNRYHYMPLIARLTPYGFHRFYNRLRGRVSEDTFRTRYRANSRAQIARLAESAGLAIEALRLIEGRPEYMRLTVPTYLVGRLYERLVNATDLLAGLRVVLIAELRRNGV